MECVFCAVVAGDLPASQVYDDERVLAFADLHPATTGHLLVVPKRHAPDLAALEPEDGARMFQVAQRLAAALRASSIEPEGVNLFLADGAVAGQEVLHAHLHVLPRRTGDGFGIRADFASPSREELDRVAGLVRAALGERD
jgi:diadenosine tetraphosphate (Ap4A) HIT family hydrolase